MYIEYGAFKRKDIMVKFVEIDLESGIVYRIHPLFNGNMERYNRTIQNLNKMLIDKRPITLISPERVLSINELEEYRLYFCSYAKKKKRNMIYFQGPINVDKLENITKI